MATSYISEHSAEYYLVPALKTILQEKYIHVAPVFPWISREFNKISMQLHKNDQFHVIVMFPRRPKLDSPYSDEIYVTINRELEVFNKVGREIGVPVIAGCPNAIDLWDLSNCKNYVWINLSHCDYHEYLNPISKLKQNGCLLDKEDILPLVRNSAIFDFASFVDFFRAAKETQPYRMYGSPYKPVYFLIKTH
ncbi:hypothetical protein [Klebsiella quasipneumoniae]|uniref:hypothetical protein n=1 Tax=Klebsiella quasipneumoniae TaxID=1463165 RepID=UPI0009455C06|nr:hypothetical protein [Klebsiella quasipneumoniae]HDU5462739.1 hypothetical protein [Klebsiella quasipneumoniae subsp. similipneumoniae]